MSGEPTKVGYQDAEETLESSGASVNTGVLENEAGRVAISTTRGFTDLVFKLNWSTAPDVNSVVKVYRHDINVNDANEDTPAPAATSNERKYIGNLFPANITGDQILTLDGVPIPHDCNIRIMNMTSETIGSGWTLTHKAYDRGPAA